MKGLLASLLMLALAQACVSASAWAAPDLEGAGPVERERLAREADGQSVRSAKSVQGNEGRSRRGPEQVPDYRVVDPNAMSKGKKPGR